MKTIKILVLVSILAVTQSFALSQTQKNFLLGLGAGAIIVHALKPHHDNKYEKQRHNVVYTTSHNKNKKRHMKKRQRHAHKHYKRANRHHKHYHRNNYRYNSLAHNRYFY